MIDYGQLLAKCEDDIRNGLAHSAAKQLTSLNLTRVPREWRLPLAQICRRVGLYYKGIGLLSAIVYPRKGGSAPNATAGEKVEYGALLLRIGATDEAKSMLAEADENKAPECLLIQSYVAVTEWDLELALAVLDRYLKTPLDSYQYLVARANLGLAHLELRHHDVAAQILDEQIRACREGGHKRLLAASYSQRAQLHVQTHAFSAARRDIEEGQRHLESGQANNLLYVRKWKLILDGLESGKTAPFEELKRLALSDNSWEEVRLADLYSLKVKFKMEQFQHLIFGTPFAGFRNQMMHELGKFPERDFYVMGPKKSRRMDLHTGKINGEAVLTPGRQGHQLLEILLRDFYRPVRTAGIFSALFKDQHFDLNSSPNRVHSAVKRFRRWLDESRIPIDIDENGGFYSLQITGDFSFQIPLNREPVDFMDLHFEKLARAFEKRAKFSALEARDKLGFSRRTLQRVINWGIEHRRLERVGQHMDTTYAFVAPGSLKAS